MMAADLLPGNRCNLCGHTNLRCERCCDAFAAAAVARVLARLGDQDVMTIAAGVKEQWCRKHPEPMYVLAQHHTHWCGECNRKQMRAALAAVRAMLEKEQT